MVVVILQRISKGGGGGITDSVNLDIHAIADLQKRGFPPTNDKAKYKYTSDDQGNYSEFKVHRGGYFEKSLSTRSDGKCI